MTRNKKIALTGGIGSGKSTAGELLREMGYPVFSCDEIYAELSNERKFLELLASRFPSCVTYGKLDRKKLSETVFSDEASLLALNSLTHPLIYERLLMRMEKFPLSFAEVPLLFESGREADFNEVFVVIREKSARIASIKARSGLSEAEILARMAKQYDYSSLPEFCKVIENNGTRSDLRRKLQEMIASL